MTIYTVEVAAHTGAGVETFYLASGRFNTGGADVPAHQHFHPSLEVPANIERALFSSGSTTGASTIGFGEIKVANAHGRYDAWADYAFDGRPCIVKAIPTDAEGRPLWLYKDTAPLIRGTVESLDVTDAFRTIRLRLYDRLSDLDRPLLTSRYAGTTISAGLGAEGIADLKDVVKPRVYGTMLNVVPVDVNPFDLVRQVSDKPCASIALYDGGLALTATADHASLAALVGASLAPRQYATALALGLVRLGGMPTLTVTADVTAVGGGSAAEIAQQMLLDFGLAADELDEVAFDALAAASGAPCGAVIADDRSAMQAVIGVLRSVGGWIVPNGDGVFTVGRIEAPSGDPVAVFKEWQIRGDLQRLAPSDSNRGIPAYRVVVRYGRLGRVQQDGELAGAVDATRRAALGLEWRQEVAENLAVKSVHLQAQELTFETCFVEASDAAAEATRLLVIYGVRRDVWRIAVDMTGVDYRADPELGEPLALPIDLGSVVTLQASRFLATPRLLVVIGRVEDCVANRIQFDLWG